MADETIARGLNRAMKSSQRSASEIWAEFATVRTKLANSASNQEKLAY